MTPDAPVGAVERMADPSAQLVVRVSGEIDISNADALGRELERMIGPDRPALVVDMAELTFMDSSGIAMLLHAAARADSVAVRNPSDLIRRVIDATGLTDVLPTDY